MRIANPIYSTAEDRVDSAFTDDAFSALLEARLQRRNARLWSHLLAWADILDALGWCVALNAVSGPPTLSSRAREALGANTHSPVSWNDVERHLRANPPHLHRVNDRDLHVWTAATSPCLAPAPAVPLTRREAEVLHWLREGKTGPETALILDCAPRTVESHVARLYRKLGFRSRSQVHLHPTPPS